MEQFQKIIQREHKKGFWNAVSFRDLLFHEFGHALGEYLNQTDDNYGVRKDYAVYLGLLLEKRGKITLSRYSSRNDEEFLAEVISALSVSPDSKEYNILRTIFLDDNFVDLYREIEKKNGDS